MVDEAHQGRDGRVAGFGRDQPVHLLGHLPVRGVSLGRGPQLDQVHGLTGVELQYEAHTVRQRDRIGHLGGEAAEGRVVKAADRSMASSKRQARPAALAFGSGEPVRSGPSVCHSTVTSVPLQVAEGAVVGEDVEAVVEPFEGTSVLWRRLARSPTYASTTRDAASDADVSRTRASICRSAVRVREEHGGDEVHLGVGIECGERHRRCFIGRHVVGEEPSGDRGHVVVTGLEVVAPGLSTLGKVDPPRGTTGSTFRSSVSIRSA